MRITVALSLLQQRHCLSPRLGVAMFGKLKIGESQITVTGCAAAYQSQISGAFAYLRGGTALDAMIGDLLMRNVAGLFPGMWQPLQFG